MWLASAIPGLQYPTKSSPTLSSDASRQALSRDGTSPSSVFLLSGSIKLLYTVKLNGNAHEPTVVISKERHGEQTVLTSYSSIGFKTLGNLHLSFERYYTRRCS